jgi:GNAT superfamily N-acetyltransferase
MWTTRDATYWDIRPLAGVLAAAALPTILGRWMEAEPVARGRQLFHHHVARTAEAIQYGAARIVENGDQVIAAALWLPCKGPRFARAVTAHDGSAFAAKLGELDAASGQAHEGQPHLRLAGLGVLPRWQRHGIASMLLTEDLADVAAPVRCLLAADDAVTAVAVRCGYRPYGDPALLGRGLAIVQPMLRTADCGAVRVHVNAFAGKGHASFAGSDTAGAVSTACRPAQEAR